MRLALGCLLLALPVLAQLDSSTLRAKFGPPWNRDTFRVRPGLDLAVDYGASGQVCTIEIPALPEKEKQGLLTELVPDSARGKELNRFMENFGLAWASSVEYEHVTIVETGQGDTLNSTTVRFKTQGCP
jgi:hypothetical protein